MEGLLPELASLETKPGHEVTMVDWGWGWGGELVDAHV